MSCITEILKLKGDQPVMLPLNKKGKPWIAVEGGGIYKEYEYLIVLNTMGHRCGYVAIPPIHPYDKTPLGYPTEKSYDYVSLDIQCHGGLTFMDASHGLKELLTAPCTDKWIGFDCGHCGDLPDTEAYIKYFNDYDNWYINNYKEKFGEFGYTVKSYDYVEKECQNIIEQLIENETIK